MGKTHKNLKYKTISLYGITSALFIQQILLHILEWFTICSINTTFLSYSMEILPTMVMTVRGKPPRKILISNIWLCISITLVYLFYLWKTVICKIFNNIPDTTEIVHVILFIKDIKFQMMYMKYKEYHILESVVYVLISCIFNHWCLCNFLSMSASFSIVDFWNVHADVIR